MVCRSSVPLFSILRICEFAATVLRRKGVLYVQPLGMLITHARGALKGTFMAKLHLKPVDSAQYAGRLCR